ncbi:bacterioferritin-associated ferredoxin [Aquisalimonas sp.]|uniref:bacterioferritin-associated ferredoxin n=1 Tax=Aquisalimonas sp. TaxID=1872621 RepID=UPI0025BA0099|nr:bacterioferritin-associated ferredoxin [Aquisalimonas sp.]
MYICVCRAITDHDIRRAVANGARTMRELRLHLGVCSSCGRCGPEAREILTEACASISATAVYIDLPAMEPARARQSA